MERPIPTEGPEHGAGEAPSIEVPRWVGSVEGRCSPSPLGGRGHSPRKLVKKINSEISYVLHFRKLKWSRLQCRQGFRIGTIIIAIYMGLDRW